VLTPAYLGSLLVNDLVVVDVGARWGASERWRPFGPRVRVIGFDPDEKECARLTAEEPDVTYVPLALGRKAGRATLYRTVEPACSSLYPPVDGLADGRPALKVIRPDGEEIVTITTLDDWLSGSPFDEVHVLKLDTQGSELGVLEGAERELANVRVLEIEVELNPIYEGQPLFGDVDRFLRTRGFVLWRLGHLAHYALSNVPVDTATIRDRHFFDSQLVEIAGWGGQVFWGHAYYVAADMVERGPVSVAAGARDACAAAAFGFVDLAASRLGAADLPMECQSSVTIDCMRSARGTGRPSPEASTKGDTSMNDHDLLEQISELVEEEHTLRTGSGLDQAGRKRMSELEVQLDRAWDLLRRRKAREEFGQNPDLERVQPESVVEDYQQ